MAAFQQAIYAAIWSFIFQFGSCYRNAVCIVYNLA